MTDPVLVAHFGIRKITFARYVPSCMVVVPAQSLRASWLVAVLLVVARGADKFTRNKKPSEHSAKSLLDFVAFVWLWCSRDQKKWLQFFCSSLPLSFFLNGIRISIHVGLSCSTLLGVLLSEHQHFFVQMLPFQRQGHGALCSDKTQRGCFLSVLSLICALHLLFFLSYRLTEEHSIPKRTKEKSECVTLLLFFCFTKTFNSWT